MRSALTLVFLASATIACNTSKTPTGAPIVAAPTQAANPGAPAPIASITGKVQERLDASPYCYLRLKTDKGEIWAAIPETKVEKGAEVSIANPMLMANFESKTLNRTFPEVYFGTLAPAGGAPAAPAAPGPTAATTPSAPGTPAAIPVAVGKVDKASGADARTISETWAQKSGLKEKSVSIRGKVVKYNPGVMGKNWMHLQDGSGDASKGSHDITVTTLDTVAKGDVVTIKGTVRLDKDFGAGYVYPLIVEDAKVVKK